MRPADRKVVLVTRRSRLEDLLVRFNTRDQAKFYVEHLGADFGDYAAEHETYQAARKTVVQALEAHGRFQVIDRSFLPNFIFGADDVVLALGQDGVVANTLKYLDGQPLAGINPDPQRWDGVLLPWEPGAVRAALPKLLSGQAHLQEVTMGEARFADGQCLHAVNDFFIGPKSHTSARYEIRLNEQKEIQSSSGIIVSTGLGSTGWMRSVVTGSCAVAADAAHRPVAWKFRGRSWADRELRFAVREPFPSRSSQASLVCGSVAASETLVVTSLMAENGVIFSDGVEADFLAFNAGTMVQVRVASKVGRLVQ
ncbi:MAG: sugar kinase [Pseudomonadota bacterium]